MPELKDHLARVISDHTAGDPMQHGVIWTDLTQEQIANELAQLGTPISTATVQNLLAECKFSKRKAQRRQSMGFTPNATNSLNGSLNLRRTISTHRTPS